MRRFLPATRDALAAQGWRLATLPPGLSLQSLRDSGAPFKGDRFFRDQAPLARHEPYEPGDIAYRPGLMPGSLESRVPDLADLLRRVDALLPEGAAPCVAPAAPYVWLLLDHHARTGEWLLTRCFTWTADRWGPGDSTRLVAGVMSGARPLLISPLPEGHGRGVGLLPLIVPARPVARALP